MASLRKVVRKYSLLLLLPLCVLLCVLFIPRKVLHSPVWLCCFGGYSLFSWFSYFDVCIPNVSKPFSIPFYFIFLFSWIILFISLTMANVTISFQLSMIVLGVFVIACTSMCYGLYSCILVWEHGSFFDVTLRSFFFFSVLCTKKIHRKTESKEQSISLSFFNPFNTLWPCFFFWGKKWVCFCCLLTNFYSPSEHSIPFWVGYSLHFRVLSELALSLSLFDFQRKSRKWSILFRSRTSFSLHTICVCERVGGYQ